MRNIHPSAVIYPNAKLGKNVVIGANSVIGGEGFGFDKDQDFVYSRIPHIGGVIIGDNVEIGACTCVDRAQARLHNNRERHKNRQLDTCCSQC
jgi:UDP-3-O-[3-hydroxymyristoyl] glucosamine N-acyltransferase